MAINFGLVLGGEFWVEGGADAIDNEGGGDDVNDDDGPTEEPKKYGMTK
jgi:hypothetical protein